MKQVLKWPVKITDDVQEIGAGKVVFVALQGNGLCVWAEERATYEAVDADEGLAGEEHEDAETTDVMAELRNLHVRTDRDECECCFEKWPCATIKIIDKHSPDPNTPHVEPSVDPEQEWREACAKCIFPSTDLYEDSGLIDWIRQAFDEKSDPDRRWCIENAGACVRAMRGDDTDLPPVHHLGIEYLLRGALIAAARDEMPECESWLYTAWRQLKENPDDLCPQCGATKGVCGHG